VGDRDGGGAGLVYRLKRKHLFSWLRVVKQGSVYIDRLSQTIFAYLSACSTAENRASRLQDEVVHLASGFQVAGFSHVIASMRSSNDKVCVEMANGTRG
jgi:CHAT domain-containing protein